MSTFTNPYLGLPESETTRTTFRLSNKAIARLKQCYPKDGVQQTTLSLLLEKLINSLDHNGITEYNAEQYESFVAECVILDGRERSTATVSAAGLFNPGPAEAVEGNDGRGTSELAQPPVAASDSHDPNGAPPRAGRRGTRKHK